MDSAINETPLSAPAVYTGQFGDYTITQDDRRGVVLYRTGLMVAALAFGLGTVLALGFNQNSTLVQSISLLYTLFWLGLGLSLATIHIYLVPLHRVLQGVWLLGGLASLVLSHGIDGPLAQTVVETPAVLWGLGFTFVALAGIFFKEAFCFDRIETKLLTPLVPLLLLGHLFGVLPLEAKQTLLAVWAMLFLVFALRKAVQPIVPDIGDKSVFAYLKQQRSNA
ncbi:MULTISPECIES: DUF2301 domain-containing membrane protein [Cyanophyceae]|uniref:DUF2301 domain-containing membrane protein n=1 Tax=Cyanophyceae TaxID=3028117 RepID=UPI001689F9D3|nr:MULTISPECIES: DUF2301 domain-containing membrane protein [Cyanophyceae]MBD1916099.1 DUF2301 domain-containing membrane protein [Phormidium sp. FACHB-77]MBD2031632.1 DUF2301 domain-containing membrane protein [Phormidium sp. FACHB-322]MBD2052741.1 DUF2301 domain-containing membrane protein [Leptolyngbya sp. FACHB-60]